MSAAIKAKSARARATIAANMMKRQSIFGRSFDDCFEMNDGHEVIEWLIHKILNDRELAWNIDLKQYYLMPRDDSDRSIRFRQAVDYALGRTEIKPKAYIGVSFSNTKQLAIF